VTTRKFFKIVVDEESAYYFNDRVCFHLNQICDDNGLSEIYDIDGTSINPNHKIIFGQTELFNSTKRLTEYAQYASKEQGKEVIIFSKKLAKHLARENYPIFEPFTASFIKTTIGLAENAMKVVFGHR